MNNVSLSKIRKLAVKKIVFPTLFGLVALATQMMGPVAYLYAQGGTISLSANVQSPSIICVSVKMKDGTSQQHPHIHHPKLITFARLANPGERGTIQTFKDHTCKGTALNTIQITIPVQIPNSPTLSKCTIVLGTKIGKLKCQ